MADAMSVWENECTEARSILERILGFEGRAYTVLTLAEQVKAHIAGLDDRLDQADRFLVFVVAQKFELDDDPHITCVLCGEPRCNASFVTRAGGVTATHGLHIECQRKARKKLSG